MNRLFWLLYDGLFRLLHSTFGKAWRAIARPRVTTVDEYQKLLRFGFIAHRFDSYGRRCGIGSGVRFRGPLRLHIGDASAILDRATLCGVGEIRIGSRSSIGHNSVIVCRERVEIGDDVALASYCYLIDMEHGTEINGMPIQQQPLRIAPIVIEDDVWIGTQTVILKGVRIGRGAIIAANSVVHQSVPPYSIVAGNPARVIDKRREPVPERPPEGGTESEPPQPVAAAAR